MIEQLICKACRAKLNRVDLERLKHVVIRCPECGQVNDYVFDPARYVRKTAVSSRAISGTPSSPDTLKLPKKHT